MDAVVLQATCDLADLGIRRGDRVVFDPRHSAVPRLVRGRLAVDLVNTGRILGAFSDGALIPLTPVPRDLRLALAG